MIAPPDGMRPRCRERFLVNRNDRGATCLSPEGEFVAEQCRELRTVAKRFCPGKIVLWLSFNNRRAIKNPPVG